MPKRTFAKYVLPMALAISLQSDKTYLRYLLRNEEALEILKHEITTSEPLELKVGEHFPLDLILMDSCNNLDVIKHEEKYYFAFRTAPSHFASDQTLMHILSSRDGLQWSHENTIKMGADLREPRFLSFKEKLFLYFFKAGIDWTKFEPQAMYFTEQEQGIWAPPVELLEPGYVPWRIRVHDGKAYLSAYNGKNLYEENHQGAIYLFQSDDGRSWEKISLEIKLPFAEEFESILMKKRNYGGLFVSREKVEP